MTNGQIAQFQVAATSVAGTSAYSATAQMTWGAVATVPAQVGAPTTAISGDFVTVSWPISNGNGGAPTAYSVVFQKSDSTYVASASCNGALASIVNTRTCTVPMYEFRQAPFSLALNANIIATVTVTNTAGTSVVSSAGQGATA